VAPRRVEAVTFDYWNTLIAETSEPFERRQTMWTEILLDAGQEVSEEQLVQAFKSGWEHFQQRWRANEQSTVVHVAEQAVSSLSFEVGPRVRDMLVEAYLVASRETPRSLLPGAAETLDALGDLEIAVGVICDVGIVPSSQLRDWLEELDVHHHVRHFSFSDEVGVYKPHERIFHHALEGLEVRDPSTAAHIGDLKRTDIVGARAVGMTTVRYTGGRDDDEEGEEADHVLDDHLALLSVLGLVDR
jgi:putative hydrolase of the HAD superfamily